jgi:hypothetical protein
MNIDKEKEERFSNICSSIMGFGVFKIKGTIQRKDIIIVICLHHEEKYIDINLAESTITSRIKYIHKERP